MASCEEANVSKTGLSSNDGRDDNSSTSRNESQNVVSMVVIDNRGKKMFLRHASTQTSEETPSSSTTVEKSSNRSEDNAAAELPKLCDTCSKSMLYYIAAVQQFLDGIARDVGNKVNPMSKYSLRTGDKSGQQLLHGSDVTPSKNVDAGHGPKSRKKVLGEDEESFLPGVKVKSKVDEASRSSSRKSKSPDLEHFEHSDKPSHQQDRHSANVTGEIPQDHHQSAKMSDSKHTHPNVYANKSQNVSSENRRVDGSSCQFESLADHKDHRDEFSRDGGQTGYNVSGHSQTSTSQRSGQECRVGNEYSKSPEGIDNNNSIMENEDRLVQGSISDASQNICGDGSAHMFSAQYGSEHTESIVTIKTTETWAGDNGMLDRNENLTETHIITDEAFVTLARNNADAIGCLVLGASLIRSKTNRTLCVLVSNNVSVNFLGPLSSVFHVVQKIRSLDSLGTTKLALLDQPELGISFMKLDVWRLVQFTKCVYMNCDTVVVKNCDELFSYEELSAVPDIGWPDCFNSAVFVFRPSMTTFWKLLDFAEQNVSYDGGDQGILNDFFSNWSEDINKKLSFIYNLMANVSYGYTPAFRRFGQNVKVVQFIGTLKPWHVKFVSESGKIASSTAVHPTYVRFIQFWLHIFRTEVIPHFSQEIRNHVSSHEMLSPDELLRFFPSSSDLDVQLSPISVRLHPTDHFQTGHTNETIAALRRLISSSAENNSEKSQLQPAENRSDAKTKGNDVTGHTSETEKNATKPVLAEKEMDDAKNQDVPLLVDSKGEEDSGIPGSSLRNYQGMLAWEQGRMDYQGDDNSDTIIKRLHLLIRSRPEQI